MNFVSAQVTSSTPSPLLVAELPIDEENERRLLTLSLENITRLPVAEHVQALTFHTDDGDFEARYHGVDPSIPDRRAALWLSGAAGGVNGPAHGLYSTACERLQSIGFAGLRADYRHPNELTDCILDALLAVAFLQSEGFERVALVGHSFGGAVAISAGAQSTEVTAVVAMSTQTYGADFAREVSPRPLLVLHGSDDEVLSPVCSELVHAAARDPKELKLFPGARHDLDSVRDELLALLERWLMENT
jgi:hypothetical protein